ncbi:hypothetical protein HBH56_159290 [Parastagonospora nodorum]|uniref:Uncharacterized protein n=1 Tax=Phaeosphaeria nodorum (strain SN15 / ATCC MYA-4574 / FGSC 10173) TaxID=321614 RepID=A0A7U2I2T2_PHANO|nr:hypothetical protein HBH56_159290 [Parastagonospora nodorum]QRC97317.1 hypothetical protein JI435_088990 [Parastagonospora nodorum SN15]KAH3922436.1 hypothetical protein HBH54_223720 [Parastagonospora nodorum]KAH4127471.1 hypothetical protein HBH45_217290 [Parastagonospora nodorum]KAH4148508.1 hypothetical protein HBH44_208550 [Parastagonospora nodorum]
MATIHKQIINSTLGDGASVAELLRRQATFLSDTELPTELRSRGLELFNTALFTDTPATSQARRSVVTVLRHTIEAIEALYIGSDRQQAAVREADKSQGSAMGGIEDEPVPDEQKFSSAHKPTKQRKELGISKSPRVQAALEARRKRRDLTHAPRMSATTGVLKALNRPRRTATSGPAKRINAISEGIEKTSNATNMPSPPTFTNRTTRSKGIGSKPNSTPEKPSLIVKLHIPSPSLLTIITTTTMKQEKPVRRSKRVKVKSEGFVTSDIEGNGSIFVSNNEDDIEMLDAPHTATKLTTRSSTRARTPSAKSLASSTPSTSQSRSNTSWETTSSSTTSSPSIPAAPTTHRNDKRLDKRSSTSPSTGPTTPQLSPPTITTPKPHNRATKPSIAPTTQHTYTSPPFPKLPAPRRAPFYLGATIALSNILEDHALYPDETLLETIKGLEDDLPTFERDDWEHRTVVKGGMWVCGMVREAGGLGLKGGGEKGEEVKKGKGKGKRKRKRIESGDEEVDVVEIVQRLEEWVEREWERTRPAEKVVVVLAEEDGDDGESEDDCGSGSRYRTPEVEDFERRKRKS